MTRTPAAEEASVALLVSNLEVFLTVLVDVAGRPLEVPTHLLEWAALIQGEPRLVLRAPRGHGKTTLLLAYALWCCWRHNRTATGWLVEGDVPLFDIVLFSATDAQVLELMTRFRDLLLANERLFGELLPEADRGAKRRTRWSAREIRLRNRSVLRARTFRSSVRGLHPDVALLDDVLNDGNSLTSEQRDKTYRWFMGTLMPMHAAQITIIGTALHQADLLATLGKKMGQGVDKHHTPLGFRAETYRALDEATGESLWPEHFPVAELFRRRDADPLIFSREYQNDPRDDAASLFPYELTQRAIDAGAVLVLGTGHRASRDEIVVLGVDVARSEAARADFTAVIVVAWNLATGTRRVLDIRREKGLEFDAQVELICDLTVRHGVLAGMVEDNGFQQWLLDRLRKRPEARGRIFGHRTGSNKSDLRDGIPRLVLEFKAGNWIIPSGDAGSLRLARVLQAELGAFGYKGGRLTGVGEHDDTVIAAWLVEHAIRWLDELRSNLPSYELITGEDLGIERVRIGEDW